MMTPTLAFLLLMGVLYLYAITAAIDFGSGAILLWSVVRGRVDVYQTVERYASPIWEVVNVFFILFAVGFVGYFPKAIPLVGTVMLVPGAVGLGAIAVRSLAFVLRAINPHHAPRLFPWLLGVTGVLAPLPFVSLFALLHGTGYSVVGGVVRVDLAALLLNPITLIFMAVAVASEFALAALFLAYYARASGLRLAADSLRRMARPWLVAMGILLVVALGALIATEPAGSGWQWPLFALGVVGLGTGLYRVRLGDAGGALLSVLAGSLLGLLGMAAWQLPWLVLSQVSLASVFTGAAMSQALTLVLAIGIVLVVPALIFLGRLVLQDAVKARAV